MRRWGMDAGHENGWKQGITSNVSFVCLSALHFQLGELSHLVTLPFLRWDLPLLRYPVPLSSR